MSNILSAAADRNRDQGAEQQLLKLQKLLNSATKPPEGDVQTIDLRRRSEKVHARARAAIAAREFHAALPLIELAIEQQVKAAHKRLPRQQGQLEEARKAQASAEDRIERLKARRETERAALASIQAAVGALDHAIEDRMTLAARSDDPAASEKARAAAKSDTLRLAEFRAEAVVLERSMAAFEAELAAASTVLTERRASVSSAEKAIADSKREIFEAQWDLAAGRMLLLAAERVAADKAGGGGLRFPLVNFSIPVFDQARVPLARAAGFGRQACSAVVAARSLEGCVNHLQAPEIEGCIVELEALELESRPHELHDSEATTTAAGSTAAEPTLLTEWAGTGASTSSYTRA